MALLTLHRSPSICSPTDSIFRRGKLQTRESFALVKGAVLLLEEGERAESNEEPSQVPHGGVASDRQHRHLHAMLSLLRPEDTVKLAVRLESVSPVRVRYLLIVSTLADRKQSLLLGMDFPHPDSDQCTIGLVLPIWSDTQVFLDGDGGFSVTSAKETKIFKPVSIQTMWSVLQALHGCCERAVRGAVIPGCRADWIQFYQNCMESDRSCLNEWGAMTGLESVRKDSAAHGSTERVSVERIIKVHLRDIMRTEDLESITSKQVRSALEMKTGTDMKDYKEYIDNEMMVTMAQMDKPSKIFSYLYLGSEWNAANFEELHKNNVGCILNVTREIDNFFPESFTYMNIRVLDVESTDLLSHWNSTYTFINKARLSGQAVLVHCKMGVSRSASTVAAFVMKHHHWSLDDTLNFLRERRPIVQPNEGFLKQLHTYSGILSASQQRHSALWIRRKSREMRKMSVHSNEGEGGPKEEREGEEEQSEGEEEQSEGESEGEEGERDEESSDKEVFHDPAPKMEAPSTEPDTPHPTITVQDNDKVCQSPSRSGRMNLLSLMQSICEQDEEEHRSDREPMADSQQRSPGQRRRSQGRGRGLIYQRAHVDVSPEPRSQLAPRELEVPEREEGEENKGAEDGERVKMEECEDEEKIKTAGTGDGERMETEGMEGEVEIDRRGEKVERKN